MNQPLASQQQVVVVVEKEYDDVPKLNTCVALFILILNIFLPGFGTMFLACISGNDCCGWWCKGVLQFILFPIIIGWVWSIMTGCKVMGKSRL